MRLRIASICLLALWVASLAGIYGITRDKWHRLGIATGEVQGRLQILTRICTLATAGEPATEADLSLGAKDLGVTLERQGELVAIRCTR